MLRAPGARMQEQSPYHLRADCGPRVSISLQAKGFSILIDDERAKAGNLFITILYVSERGVYKIVGGIRIAQFIVSEICFP